MGVADHRAVPRRAPGRRARRRPRACASCSSTSSASTPARSCRRWSGRSSTTTSRPRPAPRAPAARQRAGVRAHRRSARDAETAPSPACCRRAGWSPSSARPGSARPGWRIDVARGASATDGPWLVRLDPLDAGGGHRPARRRRARRPAASRSARRPVGRGRTRCSCSTTASTSSTQSPRLATALLDAHHGVRVLATSQVPLGVDGEIVVELRAARAGRRGRAVRGARRRPRGRADATTRARRRACAGRSTGCRWRSSSPRPAPARCRSSRSPAASTTASRCCAIRPAAARRAAARSATPSAGATTCCSPTTSAACGRWRASPAGRRSTAAEQVLAALDVPAPSRSTCSTGSSTARWSRRRVADDGAVRYRLLDSIRSFASTASRDDGRSDDAAARRTPRGIASLAELAERDVRGPRQPWCVRTARAERANIDAALAWAAAHGPAARAAHRARLRLDVGGDRRRCRRRGAGPRRTRRSRRRRPTATWPRRGCWPAGWRPSPATSTSRPTTSTAARPRSPPTTTRSAPLDVDRTAPSSACSRAARTRRSLRRQRSLELAEQLGVEWQAAGAANLAAYAWLALGDTAGAQRRPRPHALRRRAALGDGWGQMHAEAMLGRIAAAEGRLDEAEERLGRAADTSAELGFAGQTALHLTHLAGVHQRRGEHTSAVDVVARRARRRGRRRRPTHRRYRPPARGRAASTPSGATTRRSPQLQLQPRVVRPRRRRRRAGRDARRSWPRSISRRRPCRPAPRCRGTARPSRRRWRPRSSS